MLSKVLPFKVAILSFWKELFLIMLDSMFFQPTATRWRRWSTKRSKPSWPWGRRPGTSRTRWWTRTPRADSWAHEETETEAQKRIFWSAGPLRPERIKIQSARRKKKICAPSWKNEKLHHCRLKRLKPLCIFSLNHCLVNNPRTFVFFLLILQKKLFSKRCWMILSSWTILNANVSFCFHQRLSGSRFA